MSRDGPMPRIEFLGGEDFHARKAHRREYFEKFVKGWKLRPCTACAGSGRYDSDGSPPCAACDGSGKARYKTQPSLEGQKVLSGGTETGAS